MTISNKRFWVKGNTHTHTNRSDGDSNPEVAAQWFKEHGYDFMVFTDHNNYTDPSSLDLEPDPNFLMIGGEEMSSVSGKSPIHVNALGIDRKLEVRYGESKVEVIQNNVDAVLEAGGLPHINHPNWRASFDHRELLQIQRCSHMEIYNASSNCNDCGDNAHIPTEQIWDILLSAGKQIYGMATDDCHHYQQFTAALDNPGRTWIWVNVQELSEKDVLDNIKKGNFYAATGVEFKEIQFDGKTLNISVKPQDGLSYRLRFVGLHGQILHEVDDVEASWELCDSSANAYLRAKAIASDGTVAWTQAFRR
jgi:hypothetical protein